MVVRWDRIEDGIYKRTGAGGKPIYRAVRQAGRDAETDHYRQQTATFNGAKVANALRAARLWRARGEVQLDAGTLPVSAASNLTLQEVYDALHADPRVGYAPATLSLHALVWRGLPDDLKRKKLKEVGPHLTPALAAIDAPAIREKSRILVSSLFNYAVRKLHADVPNPAGKEWVARTRSAKMESSTQHRGGRYITEPELERLLAETPEEYRTLIHLMARVGLRPGEAFALTVGQFDPQRRELRIDRAVNNYVVSMTKTGQERTVPLPAVISEELLSHMIAFSDPGESGDPEALIFPAEQGGMINANNFRKRVFRPAAERAGVNHGVRVYDLRHTACSFALQHGVDPVTVANMSGHSVAVLLSTYAHYVEAAGRKAAEHLDAVIRGTGDTEEKETGSVVNLFSKRAR